MSGKSFKTRKRSTDLFLYRGAH